VILSDIQKECLDNILNGKKCYVGKKDVTPTYIDYFKELGLIKEQRSWLFWKKFVKGEAKVSRPIDLKECTIKLAKGQPLKITENAVQGSYVKDRINQSSQEFKWEKPEFDENGVPKFDTYLDQGYYIYTHRYEIVGLLDRYSTKVKSVTVDKLGMVVTFEPIEIMERIDNVKAKVCIGNLDLGETVPLNLLPGDIYKLTYSLSWGRVGAQI
jgi:hypothetical protein